MGKKIENNYFARIDALAHVYLEDSFVIGVTDADSEIEFELEVVLNETHEKFSPPAENERFCYRRAKLCFRNCSRIDWKRRTFRPYTDAEGEIDYGNIDIFSIYNSIAHLEGDWGELAVAYGTIEFTFME